MKLADWSTHAVRLSYPQAIHWASSEEDGADYLLLRLVTDDGLIGVAEGVAKVAWAAVTPRTLAVVLEDLFIPLIRGVDLLDETAVSRALAKISEHRLARSMIDVACWDLRSQAKGVPIWQLLGGDPEVPVSWTVMSCSGILKRTTTGRPAARAASPQAGDPAAGGSAATARRLPVRHGAG